MSKDASWQVYSRLPSFKVKTPCYINTHLYALGIENWMTFINTHKCLIIPISKYLLCCHMFVEVHFSLQMIIEHLSLQKRNNRYDDIWNVLSFLKVNLMHHELCDRWSFSLLLIWSICEWNISCLKNDTVIYWFIS